MRLEEIFRLILIFVGCGLIFGGVYQFNKEIAYILLGIRLYTWGAPIRLPPFFIRKKGG